jgi:hypothetical protein
MTSTRNDVECNETAFKRHPLADERTRSAVILVKALLQTRGLIPGHRREFLKIALWKVTEAEGRSKHKTQLQSQAARSAPRGTKLQHDHVFQRSKMVDTLLEAKPDAIDGILKRAVGCTITKDEHARLNGFKYLDGWDRYRAAGIVVINMETGKPFTFPGPNFTKLLSEL